MFLIKRILKKGVFMKIKNIDHLNLTVRDLEESVTWYGNLFGFEVVERGVRPDDVPWAIVRVNDTMLCLYERPEMKASYDWQDKSISRHRINHFAFRIEDPAAWRKLIEYHKIPLKYGGEDRFPHSTSWYILDPSGHEIEVVFWDEDQVRFG
jgi:catechol 2,3-dioxygenase-like lactoylglutathione lyase family enzyme